MNVTHGLEAVPTTVFFGVVALSSATAVFLYFAFIRYLAWNRKRQHDKMLNFKDLRVSLATYFSCKASVFFSSCFPMLTDCRSCQNEICANRQKD